VVRKEHHDTHPHKSRPSSLLALQADGSQLSLAREGSRTRTFNSEIEAVAFSPKGDEVATGSSDNATTIWNAASGSALRTFYYHQGKVDAISYSPDAGMILTASKDGRATIWDPTSTLVDQEFNDTGPIDSIALSRSATHIMTGSDNKLAKVWDTRNGKLLCTLSGHEKGVTAVAFNPEGGDALTGSQDFTAKIWGVDECIAAGERVHFRIDKAKYTLKGHTEAVNAVAYSPYGRWLVTASEDFTARIWDANTGKPLRVFGVDGGSHLGPVHAIAWKPPPGDVGGLAIKWHPDQDLVLTGSGDGTAKIWSAHTGLLQHTFNHGGQVTSVSWDPDGSRIITGSKDGTAKIWRSMPSFAAQLPLITLRGNLIPPVNMTRDKNHIVFGADVDQSTKDFVLSTVKDHIGR